MDSTSAGSTSAREYHGYAVTDKANDSRELKVYCEELLPFVSGDIKATDVSFTASNGQSINGANYITCTYRDDSATGKPFPPEVRKGEQVRVFNIGDTDQWYWASAGRNDNMRKTERVRYAVSDSLAENGDLDESNTYFIEMDTRHAKHIKMSTSNSNGESHSYLFIIDAASSSVTLSDEIGNTILIDSNTPSVTVKNSSDSMVLLDQTNVTVSCHGTFTVIAEGGISMTTKGSFKLSASGGATISGSTISLNKG